MQSRPDESPRQFNVLFRCIFDGRNIDVVPTFFVQRKLDEQKTDVDSIYFYWRNFDGKKINIVFFIIIIMSEYIYGIKVSVLYKYIKYIQVKKLLWTLVLHKALVKKGEIYFKKL